MFKKCFFLVLLGTSGCTMQPPSVSLPHAISSIQEDLISHHTLPVSNFTSWQNDTKLTFHASVIREQCAQNVSDPIVPIMINPVSLELSGTFNASGSFEVSSSDGGFPSIGMTGSTNKSKSQSVNVTISFSSLSSIPDVEEQVSVSRAGALMNQNDHNRNEISQDILMERSAFSEYINTLIQNWSPTLCPTAAPNKQNNKDDQIFVGVKHS